jgi:hypothetical protein
MLRNLTLLVFTAALLSGCTNNSKSVSSNTKQKLNAVKQTILTDPLTDSVELVRHLDSLPKATFPFNAADLNDGNPNINLIKFKKKKLFDVSLKRIPREIGGAGIDMDDRRDSTFNLCDTTYKAYWFLITKTPKFFAIVVNTNYSVLVTMDYNLNVINAIHIAAGDPTSNNHFEGKLTSTLYNNFKIVMHYTYNVQTDEERHFETTNEDDVWRIDSNGRFKPIRYTKPE